tara:strand:- start:883 stop:1272 length:390 start_codon:yes stop_codon:yes gene_type:complete
MLIGTPLVIPFAIAEHIYEKKSNRNKEEKVYSMGKDKYGNKITSNYIKSEIPQKIKPNFEDVISKWVLCVFVFCLLSFAMLSLVMGFAVVELGLLKYGTGGPFVVFGSITAVSVSYILSRKLYKSDFFN